MTKRPPPTPIELFLLVHAGHTVIAIQLRGIVGEVMACLDCGQEQLPIPAVDEEV